MKRYLRGLCLILIFVMGFTLCSAASQSEDEAQEEEASGAVKVTLDVLGLNDVAIYKKYADIFNGNDIILNVAADDITAITALRKFDFNSLELVINFPDENAYYDMKFDNGLLFPDNTTSVTVLCNGEELLLYNSAMQNFIISLWICCPHSVINQLPVAEAGAEAIANDTNGRTSIYEANIKLNYIYELLNDDKLLVLDEDPVYAGKLIFKVIDEVNLMSVECMVHGEAFYSVPSSYLAKKFSEADTAIYIFPVTSSIGTYSNGGEAVSTYTKVSVVDLRTMKAYKTYTAVKNEPVENLEISVEDGEYSEEGYVGAYEPNVAVNQIITSDNLLLTAPEEETDQKYVLSLIPWISFDDDSEDDEISITEDTADSTEEPGDEPETKEESKASETETEKETVNEEVLSTSGSVSTVYSWLTEDLLYKIFDALDSDDYRQEYEDIKSAGTIKSGSKGDLALGLQKTINAFGKDLDLDSSFGDKTLAALNEIQSALKLAKTSSINASTYASYMPALLIAQNESAAASLLEDLLTDENGSLFYYLKACTQYIKGLYYSAERSFEISFYDDYETRMRDCVQEMPQTGTVYVSSDVAGNETGLIVTVNNTDDSVVSCVKVLDKDDKTAACVIVRGSGEARVSLAEGEYKLIQGTGYVWYGVNELFGEDGTYENMIFDDGSDLISFRSGYDYSLVFNVLEHNETSQNVGSESVSWEDIIGQ